MISEKDFSEELLNNITDEYKKILVDFANNVNVKSSAKLVNSVKSAISYNKTNQYVKNSNGVSIYINIKMLYSHV